MKWRVWLKWVGVTCVLAAVVVGGWQGYAYVTAKEAPLPQFQATTAVTRGDIAVHISGSGSVEAADKKTVAAGSAGTVAEVLTEEGALVRKGDVLATLAGADVATQIAGKSIELERQQMELDQLRESYKTASDEQRDKLKLDLDKQQLNIRSAQEELQSLRESQQQTEITAPIDGKITVLDVEPGDTVNAAAVVAEIVNFERLQLVVGIDELDISRIGLDQTAEIRIEALSDAAFTGKVAAIADQGSSSNGVALFDVTLAIDEPGAIKPGMSAEASILIESKQDVLQLPIDAVQSMGGRYFVLKPAVEGEQEGASAPTDRQPTGGMTGGRTQDGMQGERTPGMTGDRPQSGMAGDRMQGRTQNVMPGQQRQSGEVDQQMQRGNAGRLDAAGGSMAFIEVGLNNEDYIEIVSGLEEGDIVIVPTVVSSSGSGGQMNAFPGGGFGAAIPGGGGSAGTMFPSGGGGGGAGGGGGFGGRMP